MKKLPFLLLVLFAFACSAPTKKEGTKDLAESIAKNEYFPIVKSMGDLAIWAAKDGKFAYQRFSIPEKDTLQLVLNQTTPANSGETWDLVPPHAAKVESKVTPEEKKANDIRMAKEDEIRNAYMEL